MTKKSNYITSKDNNKYTHPEKDKKKGNPCDKCGKHWNPWHTCEDASLHYYQIVNGKQVEVSNPKHEITVTYNAYPNNDKTSRKVSLSSISCT